jgi:hypothetical protein
MNIPINIPTIDNKSVGVIEKKSEKKIIEDVSYISHNWPLMILSADDIIMRWRFDRKNLIKKVLTHQQNIWYGTFPMDTTCKCQLVKRKAFLPSSCGGCNILSRLFHNGEIDFEPFNISVGKYKGNSYVIKRIENVNELTPYRLSILPHTLGTQIIDEYKDMGICESTFPSFVNEVDFLTSGRVENYVFISSFIENEMQKRFFPYGPTFRWICLCEKGVNIVEEVTDTVKKVVRDKFMQSDAKGIFIQLVSILHMLNRYAFTHGDASCKYINFFKDSVSYTYDDFLINSDVGISINPSNYSAISAIDNENNIIRLYNGNERNIPFFPVEIRPFISYSSLSPLSCQCKLNKENRNTKDVVLCTESYLQLKTIAYKIKDVDNFIHYTRHLGIPFFYSSLDLYLFTFSLLLHPEFFFSFTENPQLLILWKQLWLPTEYDEVMTLVRENQGKELNFSSLLSLIIPFYLRCDALSITWYSIKQLF